MDVEQEVCVGHASVLLVHRRRLIRKKRGRGERLHTKNLVLDALIPLVVRPAPRQLDFVRFSFPSSVSFLISLIPAAGPAWNN